MSVLFARVFSCVDGFFPCCILSSCTFSLSSLLQCATSHTDAAACQLHWYSNHFRLLYRLPLSVVRLVLTVCGVGDGVMVLSGWQEALAHQL